MNQAMPKIQLPARCDRAAAEALLPEMLAMRGKDPLQIDASGAEQIGQAMLQLLVSARRSGAGARITPSPALVEAARLTGLGATLFDEAPT
jgi:anti-anti-sigma regulatory factor